MQRPFPAVPLLVPIQAPDIAQLVTASLEEEGEQGGSGTVTDLLFCMLCSFKGTILGKWRALLSGAEENGSSSLVNQHHLM